MNTIKRFKYIIMLFTLLVGLTRAECQVTVAGPICVLPRISYDYRFNAQIDTVTVNEICVQGGILAGQKDDCIKGELSYAIRVTWNESDKQGLITFRTGSGATNFVVNITDTLTGGKLESSARAQFVTRKVTPKRLVCSPATGGSCKPEYAYQWQTSPDGLSWKDIDKATEVNLNLTEPLSKDNYYRRRVLEKQSSSVAYSDSGSVLVDPKKDQ